jgi:glycosyltransferase involved in cell wall biosynthesis
VNCLIAVEERFVLNGGRPASRTLTYDWSWKRYLHVFDSVTILARLSQTEDGAAGPAEGPGVRLFGLPGYLGPAQYLHRIADLKRRVRAACGPRSAVIVRCPGAIASLVCGELRGMARPYGAEVVADPIDVFAPRAVRHPLRPFFRRWFAGQLRRQCREACAVKYVTAHALQRRYPPAPSAFVNHCSDVDLRPSAFVSAPRAVRKDRRAFRLVSVGSLMQLYKAPDVVIDAVANLVREGLDLTLDFVGDGRHRTELEARVVARGLSERVRFLGQLPVGEAVRAELDGADIFVLPSRTEGLPRAMLEAMARALPCIGSTAGGIPELLEPEDLVPPGDIEALARKIREVTSDPQRMARMSARNLEEARAHSDERMGERRIAFYRSVRDTTARWLEAR